MNRQSIIVIIIGAIATLCGLATVDYFRRRRCGELEGTWTASLRECRLETGEAVGTLTAGSAILGVVLAVAVAFTLYRAYLFATGRVRRDGSLGER